MKYTVDFAEQVKPTIKKFKKAGRPEYKKLLKLIPELEEHPRTGAAHPEPLINGRDDVYSRRLSAQHRLIYIIRDDEVVVTIVSAEGHYDDK